MLVGKDRLIRESEWVSHFLGFRVRFAAKNWELTLDFYQETQA